MGGTSGRSSGGELCKGEKRSGKLLLQHASVLSCLQKKEKGEWAEHVYDCEMMVCCAALLCLFLGS